MDDSASDKNELPPEEPPNEFFLSWIEFIDWRSSSSNSDFFFELNSIESRVDLRPSFLLNFGFWVFFWIFGDWLGLFVWAVVTVWFVDFWVVLFILSFTIPSTLFVTIGL